MNFGVKNFNVRNDQKQKNTLMFEYYNLVDSMEWGAITFWGWYPIKTLWLLLSFITFNFLKKLVLQLYPKLPSFAKNPKGVLEVKIFMMPHGLP
jgi:hypothetical protein